MLSVWTFGLRLAYSGESPDIFFFLGGGRFEVIGEWTVKSAPVGAVSWFMESVAEISGEVGYIGFPVGSANHKYHPAGTPAFICQAPLLSAMS